MSENENFNDSAINFLFMGLSQLNEMKNKIDPEVKELLLQSASDAISSAKNFLDALETIVEQIKATPGEIVDIRETLESDDTILKFRETKVK